MATYDMSVIGSTLYIGPTAGASLQNVTILGNVATHGVVFADKMCSLALVNCTIAGNTGTAVTFAGSDLMVSGTNFTGNAASSSALAQPDPKDPSMLAAGALRLLCFKRGSSGYNSLSEINNSMFINNRGTIAHRQWGGIVRAFLIAHHHIPFEIN